MSLIGQTIFHRYVREWPGACLMQFTREGGKHKHTMEQMDTKQQGSCSGQVSELKIVICFSILKAAML